MARNALALIAALGMLTPDVCMTGCPREVLMAGDPTDAEAPEPASCCRPEPSPGTPVLLPQADCWCDAQRPPVVEAAASSTAPGSIAESGSDPPGLARSPSRPSLHVLLRN